MPTTRPIPQESPRLRPLLRAICAAPDRRERSARAAAAETYIWESRATEQARRTTGAYAFEILAELAGKPEQRVKGGD